MRPTPLLALALLLAAPCAVAAPAKAKVNLAEASR